MTMLRKYPEASNPMWTITLAYKPPAVAPRTRIGMKIPPGTDAPYETIEKTNRIINRSSKIPTPDILSIMYALKWGLVISRIKL